MLAGSHDQVGESDRVGVLPSQILRQQTPGSSMPRRWPGGQMTFEATRTAMVRSVRMQELALVGVDPVERSWWVFVGRRVDQKEGDVLRDLDPRSS